MHSITRFPFYMLIVLCISCSAVDYSQSASLEINLNSDTRMKTIKPEVDLNIIGYDIHGTGPNGATFEAFDIGSASFTQEKLASGDWIVYAEGKNASGEIIVRSPSTAVTLSLGTTARVTLLCSPLQGTGQLSISLSWPSDIAIAPEIVATLSGSALAGDPQSLNFSMTGTTSASYSSEMTLSNGFYILSVKLQDHGLSDKLLWSKVEAVEIFKDKDTSVQWALATAQIDDSSLPWLVAGVGTDPKSPISVTLSGVQSELKAGVSMTVLASAEPTDTIWSWYLDGSIVPDVSGNSFRTSEQLAPGTAHSLTAIAQDGEVAGSADAQFRVRMVSVSTHAGSGQPGALEGAAATAQFNYPSGLAINSQGKVYVADSNNNKIREIDMAGTVTTFAGSGLPGATNDTALLAQFNQPNDLVFDSAGNLYIADTGNNKIRKISAANVVSTFAGSGSMGSADGPGGSASFYQPAGLSIDSASNIYVADTNNHKIRKITPSGVVSSIAGSGVAGFQDGGAGAALFNFPSDIAIDASGAIFVADTGNHRIRKISNGTVITIAGTGNMGSADGPGMEATFTYPVGIAIGESGYLYVSDSDGNKIRKISPEGFVITLAGSGSTGSDDGPYASSTFNYPSRLAIDSEDRMYVADTNNHKIRKITQ